MDYIKPWPGPAPSNDPNPVVGNCSMCGLELRKMMMYSCSRLECPVFTQAMLHAD